MTSIEAIIEALILGLVQGLTEFLPVSSSGHLELVKELFGNDMVPKESITFTIIVHFATALSTIVVFRKDVVQLITGLLSFKDSEAMNFSLKIILSMIPAALVGILFEEEIDSLFSGKILLVGAMLIVTGLLLFLADKAKKTDKTVSFKDAIVIGAAQAIAILPGISRSGATISTSVLLGVDREKAARFSFLMVVPLILGKVAKDFLGNDVDFTSSNLPIYAAGFAAAFLAGLLACTWMISLVKRSKLSYFAYYCMGVGVLAIILSL